MFKKVDLTKYKADPHTIRELLVLCNKPILYINLPKHYFSGDIDQLVKDGLLKNADGFYQTINQKANYLSYSYKKQKQELYFLLNFRANILKLQLAQHEFGDLMINMVNEFKIKKIVSEESRLQMEYYVNNIISMVVQIREGLKNDIVKTRKNDKTSTCEITGTLIEKYAKYQNQYTNLLNTTILLPEVAKFSDFLRNKMLHGGHMMFDMVSLNIGDCSIGFCLCDYEMLELDKYSGVKDNLHMYYYDDVIEILKLLAFGVIKYAQLSDHLVQRIENSIELRLNIPKFNLETVDKLQLRELCKDKNFVLFMYNCLKHQGVPSLGQYRFNISILICNIYIKHMQLYSELYNWLLLENDKLIKNLHNLYNELLDDPYCPELEKKDSFVLNKTMHIHPYFYEILHGYPCVFK